MRSESEFRTWFIKKMRDLGVDAISIENTTSRGVPDVNLCYHGREMWCELKLFVGGRVLIRPEQFAWGMRRSNHGGNVLLLALHPNKRIHVFAYPLTVQQHGKYLSAMSLNTSVEQNNPEQLKSLLFTGV